MNDDLADRLDAELAALAAAPPPPLPGELMARVLADAARVQAARNPAPRPVPRGAWLAMAASALLGLAIGAWDGAAGIVAPGAQADTLAEADLLAVIAADDPLGGDT
jgi:hypothetical protein